MISAEKLKSLTIKSGWFDLELWDGFNPIKQSSYAQLRNHISKLFNNNDISTHWNRKMFH